MEHVLATTPSVYLFGHLGAYGRQFLDVAAVAAETAGVRLTVLVLGDGSGQPALHPDVELSARFGLDVMRLANVNAEVVRGPAFGVIAGFSRILGPALLRSFAGLVNIHPSILPAYPGPAPTYWTLRQKEQRTGFTIHVVEAEPDTGRILHQQEVEIAEGSSLDELDALVGRMAAALLPLVLGRLGYPDRWDGRRVAVRAVYKNPRGWSPVPPAHGASPTQR